MLIRMIQQYLCMAAPTKSVTGSRQVGSPITMLLILSFIIGIVVIIKIATKKKTVPLSKERNFAVGDKVTTVEGEKGQIITISNSEDEIKIKKTDNGSIITVKKQDILINHTIIEEQSVHQQIQAANTIYKPISTHILLCIFTFGIWYFIWLYRATDFLNQAPEGEQYNPTNKLLLCIFVPFYQIYWFYKHGQKLDSLMKERNIGSGSDMATLCLILGIFIPIVACILMQDKFNQLCTVTAAAKPIVKETPAQTPPSTKGSNAIDELKQYKELFDSGVITQEEFDAKKRQILEI